MSLYCVSRPARGREMRRKVTTFPAICKIRDEKYPHFYPKTEKKRNYRVGRRPLLPYCAVKSSVNGSPRTIPVSVGAYCQQQKTSPAGAPATFRSSINRMKNYVVEGNQRERATLADSTVPST